MSQTVEIKETINFSSLAAQVAQIELPREKVERILVDVKFNVTDAGIEAGETFWGVVNQMYAGQGSDHDFEIGRNEIANALALMWVGLATGKYLDPLPTTATDAYAFADLRGPFDFTRHSKPVFVMDLLAITSEWAAASAFTAVITITLILADDPDAQCFVFHREAQPTDTLHKLNLGPGVVEDLLVIAGSAVMKEVRILPDLEFERPYVMNGAWLSMSQQASASGVYLIENIDVASYDQKEVIVEFTSTATVTILTRSQR